MNQSLVRFTQALTPKGGVLAREFKRVRANDSVDWNREKAYALEIIADSDQLQRCDPASVGRSLLDLGVLGLSLSPAKKEAYLIPYKTNCTVSVSYMGMEQMAYRTGYVELIQTNVVCKNDSFRVWSDDKGRHVEHEEAISNRGEVTHVYCQAHFSSGLRHIEVMDRRDIMGCRDAAAKQNNGNIPWAWKGAFKREMYKKCGLRRGWKHWPKFNNPQLTAMMDAVDRTDPMEFTETKVVREITTLDGDQLDVLSNMMLEAGVEASKVDPQLQGLAISLGFSKIREVTADQFDTAVSLMKEGLQKWKARNAHTPGKQSGSQPEGTTAPVEGR